MIIGCVFAAMVLALWVAGWVSSQHRAAHAADLAALAAAQGHVAGEDGCDMAEDVARHNGTEAVACHVDGDLRDFVVRVRVRAELVPRLGDRARFVEVTAVAGSLAEP